MFPIQVYKKFFAISTIQFFHIEKNILRIKFFDYLIFHFTRKLLEKLYFLIIINNWNNNIPYLSRKKFCNVHGTI